MLLAQVHAAEERGGALGRHEEAAGADGRGSPADWAGGRGEREEEEVEEEDLPHLTHSRLSGGLRLQQGLLLSRPCLALLHPLRAK